MPEVAPAASRHVAVVGAGVVGTCCALYLRREGFDVTLIDRASPGEACSFGNAGGLGYASCVPAALPGVLRKVPGMLFDPDAPLILRWRHLPGLLPWLARFVANATAEKVAQATDARSALMHRLFEAWDPLIAAAGAQHLVERKGWLMAFESEAAFRGAQYGLDLRRQRGIEVQVLDQGEVRDLEPGLSRRVVRGVYLPQPGHTLDPLRLTQALVAHFAATGGTVLRREVRDFAMGEDRPKLLFAQGEPLQVDRIVIAAGAWSARLTARLGSRFPLAAERGYHVMLPRPQVDLGRLVISPERYVVLSRMADGIRVSGISEFAGPDEPPDPRLAERIRRQAQELLPGLDVRDATTWAGPRPSLPDSRPVIGRSPRHRSVLFAFGHDQVGLGTGAITGKLIAELAADRAPSVDLQPYRPDRF